MTDSDMKKKILSQINRINNYTNCLSDRRIKINTCVGNLKTSQEIQALRKNIGKQWSIINDFDVSYFINELKNAFDKKKQCEKIKKLVLERQLMNDECDVIKKDTQIAENEYKELLKKLEFLKQKQCVLEDMMKSLNGESIC